MAEKWLSRAVKPQSFLISGSFTKKEKVNGSLQKVPEDKAEEKKKFSNFQNLLYILNRTSSMDAIYLYFIGGTGV